jgi:menaquinone-9 beta-reductase
MKNKKLLIIGGGLAGLTAAIHLSRMGLQVTVIEKNDFPKHKVCGEYISNEIMPYFNWLGINIKSLEPSNIDNVQFSISNGVAINSKLKLGGFGISRYVLDNFLYKKAIENGCLIIQDIVETIDFDGNEFKIITSNKAVLKHEIVIGAFGKRSNIDQKLNRDFIKQKSPWLGVKAHYSGSFPNDLVGLYNFKGGYCGVSKVEDNKINICYLASYETFKEYKNTNDYQEKVLCKNPLLKIIFDNATLLFEKPITISQISFEKKQAVENHVLMIGDTAGLIHPLCGNGMAMAIHSAKIVSKLVLMYFNSEINSREELEKRYTQEWNFNFKNRLKMGRLLAHILERQKLSSFLMSILIKFPFLLPIIIKRTHGKPIIL